MFSYAHSGVARLGSYSFRTSIDLRPCEVARMTSGFTLSSFPILC